MFKIMKMGNDYKQYIARIQCDVWIPLRPDLSVEEILQMDLFFHINAHGYSLLGNRFSHFIGIGFQATNSIDIHVRKTTEDRHPNYQVVNGPAGALTRQYKSVLKYALSTLRTGTYNFVPEYWVEHPRWYWKRNIGWTWDWKILVKVASMAGMPGALKAVRVRIENGMMHRIRLVGGGITEDPFAMVMIVFWFTVNEILKAGILKITVKPKWFPPYPEIGRLLELDAIRPRIRVLF